MIGAVTAGLCIVQARANWDGVVPMSAATFLTTSAMARPRSLSAPCAAAMFLRVPTASAEPPPWSRAARVYLPASTPLASGDHGMTPTPSSPAHGGQQRAPDAA